MSRIVAYNVKTDKYYVMAEGFKGYTEAENYLFENEIEWDEGDVVDEWQILVCPNDTFQNGYILMDFTVEMDWEEPDFDECGFDPYEGCYTYDC